MNSNNFPSSCSLEQQQIFPNNQFSTWQTFKHHIPRFLLTMLIDIILPLALFFSLQNFIKPVYALIFAGAPPFIMIIFKAIISRTFDALGFIVFIGFIISAIVGITTEDPIMLLLGQSFITGVICLIFTTTLIPFYCCQLRPLAYYLYQDLAPIKRIQLGLPENLFKNKQNEILISDKQEVAKVYEWIYTNCSSFRRSCYIITIIWSIGLFFGFIGQLILILIHLSINIIVIYGHVILTSITILCIVLTIIRVGKERKQTMILIEEWKKEHRNFLFC
jgi:hypothetical protein